MMFRFDKSAGQYAAWRNGIRFICGKPSFELRQRAARIAVSYYIRLPAIRDFLAGEAHGFPGLRDCGNISEVLGRPVVDLDAQRVEYPWNLVSPVHIIGFEYQGDLERFAHMTVDG